MKEIYLCGGTPLFGDVCVSGSKNAALPIIFASLICNGVSSIENIPCIGDVQTALQIARALGASVSTVGEVTYIDSRGVSYSDVDDALLMRIRASSYLIGASLARFGIARIPSVGGCNFCYRPIDMHVFAAEALGAVREGDFLRADTLRGAEIRFRTASVGATANALIMSSAALGTSRIYNYAREPHINALIDFLISAGADITLDEEKITVRGSTLHGGKVRIIGDMIEAGTYLAAGVITGGAVRVSGVDVEQMGAFISFLERMGCCVCADASALCARSLHRVDFVSVTAAPYPMYPTDLQPIAAPLIARLCRGVIRDNVWRGRFGYLTTLHSFGLRSSLHGNCALVYPSHFQRAAVDAPDLRGGAACILCALCAEGESRISSADVILRGYENIEKKLRALGARIKIYDR